MQHIYSFVR